jgi:hypothetical protein
MNDVPNLAPPPSTLLDVFQVYTPVHMPMDDACTAKLMSHEFRLSYGKPFIGEFKL